MVASFSDAKVGLLAWRARLDDEPFRLQPNKTSGLA